MVDGTMNPAIVLDTGVNLFLSYGTSGAFFICVCNPDYPMIGVVCAKVR